MNSAILAHSKLRPLIVLGLAAAIALAVLLGPLAPLAHAAGDSGAGDGGTEEEGASALATAFYWVVAAGALIYLVMSRRGDRKAGKHELSNLRTAERKRQVREELVSRAQTKLDDATRKAEALEKDGAPQRAIDDARGQEALAKEQLTKHQVDLEVAKTKEREALEAVEEHDRLVQEEEERKEREAQKKADEK